MLLYFDIRMGHNLCGSPPEKTDMTREAVLAVLIGGSEGDQPFQAKLCYDAAEALKEYDLTWEEPAALASVDIRKVEEWLGK
jgi:hypothetical protein